MIYKFETSEGYSYYQDTDTDNIFMTLADYGLLSGKSLNSLAIRETETIKIESCNKPGDFFTLITQKTILQWLLLDKPEFILQLALKGLDSHFSEITLE